MYAAMLSQPKDLRSMYVRCVLSPLPIPLLHKHKSYRYRILPDQSWLRRSVRALMLNICAQAVSLHAECHTQVRKLAPSSVLPITKLIASPLMVVRRRQDTFVFVGLFTGACGKCLTDSCVYRLASERLSRW